MTSARLRVYRRGLEVETLAGVERTVEAELARLDAQRGRVLSLLASLKNGSALTTGGDEPAPPKRTRQMSDAGRQAIREAVQRRSARVRAEDAQGGANSSGSRAAPSAKAAKDHAASARSSGSNGNRKK